jgi:hypothetical protein
MARRVDYDAIANVYDRRYERNEYGDVEPRCCTSSAAARRACWKSAAVPGTGLSCSPATV